MRRLSVRNSMEGCNGRRMVRHRVIDERRDGTRWPQEKVASRPGPAPTCRIGMIRLPYCPIHHVEAIGSGFSVDLHAEHQFICENLRARFLRGKDQKAGDDWRPRQRVHGKERCRRRRIVCSKAFPFSFDRIRSVIPRAPNVVDSGYDP